MSVNSKETMKFGAEISKVLQLMIHSLYTNKDIFLRELISNASDACDKLRYAAVTNDQLLQDNPELSITISVDKDKRLLTIADTGIGMSRDELIANLGTIAKSGTQEFVAQLTGDAQKDMPLIGQFGVGFYSAFMVADSVTVVSTKAGADISWKWESAADNEFSITPVEKASRGTTITLAIKEGADDYLDSFKLRHIVTTYSDHISFPIYFLNTDGAPEKLNTASALWMRAKAEVSEEQYKEFYHHVAHAVDEPWTVLHNKVEGKVEYTNLLFLPSSKPFDLFHPDRKTRVKLYVKRVFITEEHAELVPQYLRFLRGVVDCEDLPLNISRQTLQQNPVIAKIKDSITKRVLTELKKRADADAGSYLEFWRDFGAVLKEGLCEVSSPREAILEVSRFHSTHGAAEALVSLDEYISRMKEGQSNIFYVTGDHLDTLRQSPQLEGFAKRGIEVLLMNDHVDDFWVNVVAEYKGKKLQSVTRAEIDLDAIPVSEGTEEAPKLDNDSVQTLCARIKVILGEAVSEVRQTSKLSSSAVCLATREGGMDFRLERFLLEQKQLSASAAKILEVNPSHPIITSLSSKTDAEIEDVVWVLFDQARILEGEEISDPAAFTRRLQSFVQKSLAA